MGTEEQELEIYTRVSAGGLGIRNRVDSVNHPISVRAAFLSRPFFYFASLRSQFLRPFIATTSKNCCDLFNTDPDRGDADRNLILLYVTSRCDPKARSRFDRGSSDMR